jgi:hypothetical protein
VLASLHPRITWRNWQGGHSAQASQNVARSGWVHGFLWGLSKGNSELQYTAARVWASRFADYPHHAGGIRCAAQRWCHSAISSLLLSDF